MSNSTPKIEIEDSDRPGEIRPVWKVSKATGERSMEFTLITDDEERAKAEAAKKDGWYGSEGSYHETVAVFGEDEHWYVGGSVHVPPSLRQRALNKLTPEERKALGVD